MAMFTQSSLCPRLDENIVKSLLIQLAFIISLWIRKTQLCKNYWYMLTRIFIISRDSVTKEHWWNMGTLLYISY